MPQADPPQGDPGAEIDAPRHIRPHRRLDLTVGILVGIVAGIAVVAAFVFLGSEGSVDAPKISGIDTGKPAATPKTSPSAAPATKPGQPRARPVQVVRVVGGLPPTAAGPAQLHFKSGEKIRFRVASDAPVGIAIPDFGFERTVAPGSVVSFDEKQPGSFPIVVAGGDINLASIIITKR